MRESKQIVELEIKKENLEKNLIDAKLILKELQNNPNCKVNKIEVNFPDMRKVIRESIKAANSLNDLDFLKDLNKHSSLKDELTKSYKLLKTRHFVAELIDVALSIEKLIKTIKIYDIITSGKANYDDLKSMLGLTATIANVTVITSFVGTAVLVKILSKEMSKKITKLLLSQAKGLLKITGALLDLLSVWDINMNAMILLDSKQSKSKRFDALILLGINSTKFYVALSNLSTAIRLTQPFPGSTILGRLIVAGFITYALFSILIQVVYTKVVLPPVLGGLSLTYKMMGEDLYELEKSLQLTKKHAALARKLFFEQQGSEKQLGYNEAMLQQLVILKKKMSNVYYNGEKCHLSKNAGLRSSPGCYKYFKNRYEKIKKKQFPSSFTRTKILKKFIRDFNGANLLESQARRESEDLLNLQNLFGEKHFRVVLSQELKKVMSRKN